MIKLLHLRHCSNLIHGEGAWLSQNAIHSHSVIVPCELGDRPMIPDVM